MKKTLFLSVLICSISTSTVSAQDTEFGVAVLTPGGVNFVVKGGSLQASVGYLGSDTYGAEVGYNFIKNKDGFFRTAQIIAGSSSLDGKDWNYGGVSATFRAGGFFIEPGVTAGSGDYSSPQFSLQVGWLWD